jgi:hypothetical protein
MLEMKIGRKWFYSWASLRLLTHISERKHVMHVCFGRGLEGGMEGCVTEASRKVHAFSECSSVPTCPEVHCERRKGTDAGVDI